MKHIRKPFYVLADDAPAKQKILVAALKLFVRDGLCETSVRDIAKVSGFSNPALFKHFPSKDALAAYLFERCYLELFHLISRAARSEGNFAARQHALFAAYMGALEQDQDAVLYVQDNLRHFWPRVPVEVRKHSILGEVRMLLDSGQREGLVTKTIDIGLLTAAWVGTLQQFARVRYFGDFADLKSGRPARGVLAALESLLMRMVAA
jgi:TetR/AcrR family transcriptional regulator, repressor of fatR-cypB operon